ncbi:MAG: ATP-dependent helicase, partial [Mycobacterium sp.]|nr:ATP-dependent helicase [Mycobacterium sp.]
MIDAARKGLNTVVLAGAGAGKTSTIRLASDAIKGKGLYVAFNKAIAADARKKFGRHVDCRTAHSLAWRDVGCAFQKRLNGPRQPAREVARLLKITHPIPLSDDRL